MSECNHFWRAVDSRRSQCSKCGEITKAPCREPECAKMQEQVAALQAELERAREALMREWIKNIPKRDQHGIPIAETREERAEARYKREIAAAHKGEEG